MKPTGEAHESLQHRIGPTPLSAPASPNRVIGLDVARGALMAYIIIVIHGVFWLGLLAQPGASILLFEMPPIFIITGAAYFLSERAKPTAPGFAGYGDYLLRRGVRIMAPYWAYALVCALLMLTLGGYHDVAPAIYAWLNPALRGAGHTTLMLSWHLWFVPPFLAVTALMPLLPRIKFGFALPLWLWALIGCAIAFAIDLLDATRTGEYQTIGVYALWAAFGFALAAAPKSYGVRDYAVVLVLALAALAAAAALHLGGLNMQANKFPPNLMFYLFSCAWTALLLIAAASISDAGVEKLARSPLLRPFMQSGYSIYLWQGIGYSAATLIGRQLHWPVLAIWPLAIAITLALGLAASPLERIRLPRKRSAP